MITAPERIPTERLLLCKPSLADAQAIFDNYAQDPEVTKYLLWTPHSSVEDTLSFLKRCESVWASGEAFPYVIERREDKGLLGMIEISVRNFSANIGYVLAKKVLGAGLHD